MIMMFNDVKILSKWLERESDEGFNHKRITASMKHGVACYKVVY